jgi:cytosine/adenosine deaminase-related metal-dependent hydrolase
MSLGESKGGLPPDRVVEEEAFILQDSLRLIERYHDPTPGALTRIVLAPCSPFSVTPELMRQSSQLARTYGVHQHTHLAETLDEERFCQQTFGQRPVALMETLGWVGDDVWFAHAVHVNDAEIGLYARTGCGVAHCPSSNMRLASGIAPVQKYRAAGVKVGLGVDGSAAILCAPQTADYTFVHGKAIVKGGQVATVEMGGVIERHNRIARQMVDSS